MMDIMEDKMKVTNVIVILFTVLLTSCASYNFKRSYHPIEEGNTVFSEGKITLQDGEDPKIIRSESPIFGSSGDMRNNRVVYELVSNYYFPIGRTQFNYGSTAFGTPHVTNQGIIDEITKQCRKNGATAAIYNTIYTGNEIVWTGYGITSYKRYDCTVVYFVQTVWRDRWGWLWRPLDTEDRQKHFRNTGGVVEIVFNNSPVFKAGIIMGDIITRVNKSEINNEFDEDSFNIGDKIEIEFIRNYQTHTTTIILQ